MNTDDKSLEHRLLALKPKKLPAMTKHQILCRLDALTHESQCPQATHPYWVLIQALAASLIVIFAGYVLLSGLHLFPHGKSGSLAHSENTSLSLVANHTNLETMLFASLNQVMHNNVVATINFSHFATNSTVPLL